MQGWQILGTGEEGRDEARPEMGAGFVTVKGAVSRSAG